MGAIFGGGGQSGSNSLDQIKQVQLQQQQQAADSLNQLQPQQQQFGQALAEGAMGKGPSIADAQMKLAMEQSLQQQLAAAQAQRGVNPALAGRNAMNAASQTNMNIAGAGAANRLQEQRNQQGAFQNYLSGQQNYATGAGNAAANTAADQSKFQQHQNGLVGGLLGMAGQGLASGFLGGASKAATGGLGGYESSMADDVGNSSVAANSAPMQMRNVPVNGMSTGGVVEGPEIVEGNSPENDVVPKQLSSGEVVVPKTIVEQGGKAAGAFVDALKEHYEQKEKIKKMTFGDVLAAKKGK